MRLFRSPLRRGVGALLLTALLSVLLTVVPTATQAVDAAPDAVVAIDMSTQRFVGDVSALDRSTFFNVHGSVGGDPQMQTFLDDYGVSTGRQFWDPLVIAKNETGSVGTYPSSPGLNNRAPIPTSTMVATGHPGNAMRYNTDLDALADWVVRYYSNQSVIPQIYEPMNEPFVHAGDGEFSDAPSQEAMRRRMAEMFAAVGQRVHETPALDNMKVIGYSSAWPSMERWNFSHWETRMKMFMDVAGADMDGFATHLYDGVNVTGQNNRRSGSNSEAILDLIETYSYSKWGIVKPHAITEYGGIERGFPSTYNDLGWAQSVRSMNSMMFNLLERENDMLISIPFITDKSRWHLTAANDYQPYGATLFRPVNAGSADARNGPFVYTWRVNFYELWKDVVGTRGYTASSDPDIQTQLFVDGSTAYLAVNNLADEPQTVGLDMLSSVDGLTSVQVRTLEVPIDSGEPTYVEQTVSSAPETITLGHGGTAVLVYQFGSPITIDNTVRSTKYYTGTHLQPIAAGTPIGFSYSGVQGADFGSATLRMSIGRVHANSKQPTVTVNGTEVEMPTDWKGYDQANRDDFFGMIEIPVPLELIQATTEVGVTFPDAGGHVSSMILQVEASDRAIGEVSVLMGDVTCDSRLTVADAVVIAQHTVGLRNEVTSCPMDQAADILAPAADINGSGNISVADAVVVAQCIAGIESEFCPA